MVICQCVYRFRGSMKILAREVKWIQYDSLNRLTQQSFQIVSMNFIERLNLSKENYLKNKVESRKR